MIEAIAIFLLVFHLYLGFRKPGYAFLTSPIASILLFYFALKADSIEAMVIAPVIFVVTLVIVSMTGRGTDLDSWPRRLARGVIVALILLGILALATGLFGLFGFYVFILFIMFIALLIGYFVASRDTITAYVISTIGSSMRQNLPLPMALESAVSGQTDRRARILRRIKKWLVQGYSLSESIKRGYPKCPGFAVAIISTAERINQLPYALRSLENDMISKADENRRVRPINPIYYPLVLIFFIFIVVLGLMQFVVPVFHDVLTEMIGEDALPPATRFLMNLGNFIAYDYGWLIGAILLFLFAVLVPIAIRIRFRPRRADKPYFISRLCDFIKWRLPIFHWFEKNYSMLQIIELLRLSLNADCTVNESIANTLNLDINDCFKKRVRKWLSKVEAGENIADSAKQCNLGDALAWAFESTEGGGTLSVLETLESFYRSNYSYGVNLAMFILWPCVTIVMGIVVGFVAFAIYSPMVVIISGLAASVT